MDTEKAKELLEELKQVVDEKLGKKLSMKDIVKIVEVVPKDLDELKLVFVRSKVALKKEELEILLDIVKKYV